MIKTLFIDAVDKYSDDRKFNRSLWADIVSRYSRHGRYYHTLTHLESLSKELMQFQHRFKNPDTVIFSIVYHDIIYNSLRRNNEERSAIFAKKNLSPTTFPGREIDRCAAMILATKHHLVNDDEEINLFTDADLSILGADEHSYFLYTKQVRKEYFWYPDFMYLRGRKKVLEHFLKMERIYKTESFYERYEVPARLNLKSELDLIEEK